MPLHQDTPNKAAARTELCKRLQAPRAGDCPQGVHADDWAAVLHMRAVVRGELGQPANTHEADAEEPIYTPKDG